MTESRNAHTPTAENAQIAGAAMDDASYHPATLDRPLADRVEDLLGDLHERMFHAANILQDVARREDSDDSERLGGKREGLLLAQDYLRFTMRTVRALIEEEN